MSTVFPVLYFVCESCRHQPGSPGAEILPEAHAWQPFCCLQLFAPFCSTLFFLLFFLLFLFSSRFHRLRYIYSSIFSPCPSSPSFCVSYIIKYRGDRERIVGDCSPFRRQRASPPGPPPRAHLHHVCGV